MAIDPVSVSPSVTEIAANGVPVETVHALQPIVDVITPMLSTVSWLLGGFFGLYLMFVIIKLYFDYRRVRLLRSIRDDVKFLKENTFPDVDEPKKNKFVCKLCNIFKKEDPHSEKSVDKKSKKRKSKKSKK